MPPIEPENPFEWLECRCGWQGHARDATVTIEPFAGPKRTGVLLMATCPKCNSYIKFLRQERAHAVLD
jgi:formate dehydrogenase maturation protein FdhE